MVISRALWRQSGALTLRRRGNDFIVETARPKNFDRPWSPAALPRNVVATSVESAAATGDRTPDATPRQEDIEADQ